MANGIATIVVAKLIIVTDQSLSSPLRRTAFHAACNAAAKSTSPITAGFIAVPKSRVADEQLRVLPCWSLAPKGNQTFTHPFLRRHCPDQVLGVVPLAGPLSRTR